jgi:hypothetical protein
MESNDMTQSWRTSSYTGNGGGNCVEVTDSAKAILVRDTKDRDSGTLEFTASAWQAFIGSLK